MKTLHYFRIPLLVMTLLVSGFVNRVNGKLIVVTATNYSFSPATVNCQIGDTVKWVWQAGTHTTTSTSVPNGVATWDQPLNSSSTSYSYKITASGVYSYQCNFHVSMGMTGTINAVSSGIDELENSTWVTVYPNPIRSSLNIKWNVPGNEAATVSLYSVLGEKIYESKVDITKPDNMTIDCQPFEQGLYLLRIDLEKEGTIIKKVDVVK